MLRSETLIGRFKPCDHVPDAVGAVQDVRVNLEQYGRVMAAKRAVMFGGVPEVVPVRTRPRPSLLARLMPSFAFLTD